ncbi:hypothetical protein C8R43DRAFT_1143661 [Mycena crocata]|nr:hypothetical protein C8R43DRAFT_1143661 [Mycena crocata]
MTCWHQRSTQYTLFRSGHPAWLNVHPKRRQVFCQLTWILFRFDLNVSSQLPRCANLRHHTPYNIRPPMNVWLSIAGRHTTLRGIRFEAQDLDSSVWVGVYASAQYLLLHSTPMLSITVVISIPATATAVVLHTPAFAILGLGSHLMESNHPQCFKTRSRFKSNANHRHPSFSLTRTSDTIIKMLFARPRARSLCRTSTLDEPATRRKYRYKATERSSARSGPKLQIWFKRYSPELHSVLLPLLGIDPTPSRKCSCVAVAGRVWDRVRVQIKTRQDETELIHIHLNSSFQSERPPPTERIGACADRADRRVRAANPNPNRGRRTFEEKEQVQYTEYTVYTQPELRFVQTRFITGSTTLGGRSFITMVLGPNGMGSGKSSIACAICLARHWSPEIIGRATGVDSLIKNGVDTGSIEIGAAEQLGMQERTAYLAIAIVQHAPR